MSEETTEKVKTVSRREFDYLAAEVRRIAEKVGRMSANWKAVVPKFMGEAEFDDGKMKQGKVSIAGVCLIALLSVVGYVFATGEIENWSYGTGTATLDQTGQTGDITFRCNDITALDDLTVTDDLTITDDVSMDDLLLSGGDLVVSNSTEGAAATLTFKADQADNADDTMKLSVADGGTLSILGTTGTNTIAQLSQTGDLTVLGGDVTGANTISIDIGEATDNAITLTRHDAGTVTLTAADNDATAALTIGAGGASTLTLGDSGDTLVTFGANVTVSANKDLIAVTDNSATTNTLISNGVIDATKFAADVAVADGGTGASTLTDGGVLLGSGTGAITPMSVLADGEIIVGDGTTDPVAYSAFTSSAGSLKVNVNGGNVTVAATKTLTAINTTGSATNTVIANGIINGCDVRIAANKDLVAVTDNGATTNTVISNGVVDSAKLTGTCAAINGAAITSLSAANLTGSASITAVTVSGFITATPTSASVTNNHQLTAAASAYVLSPIGGTNNATNAMTLANPGTAGRVLVLYVAASTTNDVSITDGGNCTLAGNWVGADGDTLTLYAPTTAIWAEAARSNN